MKVDYTTALQVCLAGVKQKKEAKKAQRPNRYTLYAGYNHEVSDARMQGPTTKELRQEFKRVGGNYTYAMIVEDKTGRVFDFFNREDKASWTRLPKETNVARA